MRGIGRRTEQMHGLHELLKVLSDMTTASGASRREMTA
jgi:hypothetical protein